MARKKLYLALLLMTWSWTSIQTFDPQKRIRDLAAFVCPYTKFCETEAAATLQNETRDPCCVQCSCADDCWETESCCLDKDDITISKPTDLVCKSTVADSILGDEHYNGYFLGHRRYFIIDSCPHHMRYTPLEKKCANEDGSTMDDFVWVTDNLSGKIFQNRYCALCHGVNNWTIWKVQTTCEEILTAGFSNVLDLLLSRSCTIINVAPEGLELSPEKFRCYIPQFTSCNQTGTWQQYDNEIEEACLSYTVPFFQLSQTFLTIYKNLYCFICNLGSPIIIADKVCPSRDDISAHQIFGALVNLDTLETERSGEFGCKMDELFDIYMQRCHKLICPIGQAPFYGKCELLASEVENLHVRFALYLRYVPERSAFSPETKTEETIYDLGEKLHAKLANSDVFSSCRISFIEVYQVNTNETSSDFIILFALCTDDGCYLNNVTDKLSTLEGEEIEIFVDEQVLVLNVNLEKRSEDGFFNETNHIFIHSAMVACSGYVELRQLLCPAFQLKFSEIIFHPNAAVKDYLLSVAAATENLAVHVCVEEYFSEIPQENIAVGRCELLQSMLEFIITVACVPFLFRY